MIRKVARFPEKESHEQKTGFCVCCIDGSSRCSARAGETTGVVRSAREPDYRERKRFLLVCEQRGRRCGAENAGRKLFLQADNWRLRHFGCTFVGHVADASYMFCSQAIGEANPAKDIEKTKTSKADLVAALKDGVARTATRHIDSMTDAKGSQMGEILQLRLRAKLTLFSINTAHTDEHYGERW